MWSILNNLTGRSRHSPRHCPVSADAIASQLVRNGKYEAVDRKSSRLVFQKVSDLWRATTPDAVNISDNFSQREFAAALQHLKPGKAPGPDSICPELILHAGAALKSWLCDFLSSCLCRLKISKIWRRALVVAIPKPGKPVGDPKSYRPISLLCVPYKILERLIYARVEPLIDPLLPKEQAGFRRGKSTIDQVVLLTQNIEDSFEAKKKASAVFINLTAAYDTVWHRGLTCKLLRLLVDKHMVKMIMELVRNRSFTLTTDDSKQSRLRRLKNGVPQGLVLAPLLFNIYTYDLPSMISRKFAYADDLALLHSSGNWKDLEGTLSQDMSTLSAYLQTWRLKLSHTKTVTTVAWNLLDNLARLGIRVSKWTNHKWNVKYCENASRLHAFVPGTSVRPVVMGLPRAAWVKLNCLWTIPFVHDSIGVGRFHSSMHKWGLAPSPNCECGASDQTADHVLTACPIHRAPHGACSLTVLDDETRCWLNNIIASI